MAAPHTSSNPYENYDNDAVERDHMIDPDDGRHVRIRNLVES